MKINMKLRWKNVIAATIVCLALGALTALAPMYPCGYTASGTRAGYGYHSLATVASEGFEWTSDMVPVAFPEFTGSGPYVAVGQQWIAAMYIPMFIAIIFLGWLILTGNLGAIIPLSRKSGKSRL